MTLSDAAGPASAIPEDPTGAALLRDAVARALPPCVDARRWPRLRRRAAVAVVLRPSEGGIEVLLMRRVARARDRWSSQISCPGGFLREGEDPIDGALRETGEEVGLELGRGDVLGLLDAHPERPWHRVADFSVQPVVVWAPSPDAALTLAPSEVVSARWISLTRLTGPGHRHRFWWWWRPAPRWPLAVPFHLARVHDGDYDVWGLTLRVLDRLGERLGGVARPGGAERSLVARGPGAKR